MPRKPMNTYTAQLPNGETSTQRSTRTYTHAVVIVQTRKYLLGAAEKLRQHAVKCWSEEQHGPYFYHMSKVQKLEDRACEEPDVGVHAWAGSLDLANKRAATLRKCWPGADVSVVAVVAD